MVHIRAIQSTTINSLLGCSHSPEENSNNHCIMQEGGSLFALKCVCLCCLYLSCTGCAVCLGDALFCCLLHKKCQSGCSLLMSAAGTTVSTARFNHCWEFVFNWASFVLFSTKATLRKTVVYLIVFSIHRLQRAGL